MWIKQTNHINSRSILTFLSQFLTAFEISWIQLVYFVEMYSDSCAQALIPNLFFSLKTEFFTIWNIGITFPFLIIYHSSTFILSLYFCSFHMQTMKCKDNVSTNFSHLMWGRDINKVAGNNLMKVLRVREKNI